MKITHVCLGAFFVDNYSYQENILPKYHKLLGYNVSVIASLQSFDKNGAPSYYDHASSYDNEYGIPVIRLDYNAGIQKIVRKLKFYVGTYEALVEEKPDILFIHGIQFGSIPKVVKYLKENPDVIVYVDNHCDYSNSATNWISKNILHKLLWKRMAQKIEPYTRKFYGVLPARVDFLVNLYGISKEKVELLVMGADDEKVVEAKNPLVRANIRKKYNIGQDDFLIMTGGKIDEFKTQTLFLMEAVRKINRNNVKLIVFGSVTQDLKDKVEKLADGISVQYIGWINSADSYQYFAASDLAVFPGRHSVFWEQVAGMGIPMLCKYWDGTTHVDLGGNVKFLYNDSVTDIFYSLLELIENPDELKKMNRAAMEKGVEIFSYKEIAKKAIEFT